MSKQHGAREQKRLAKQRARHKAKRRQLARSNSPDPTIRLQAADRWPIVATLVPESLWTMGIGNLIVARRMPDGRLACAMFLVDVFCLGVKDALWKIVTPGEFEAVRQDIDEHGRLKHVTPEYFAKLVYRAADYGQSLGFPPHRDFRHAQRLLAGIDPSQCPEEFQFGQDGQPLYIRGPYESLEDAQVIAQRVQSLGGHYTVPLTPDELPPELLDLDPADELEDEYEEFMADEDGFVADDAGFIADEDRLAPDDSFAADEDSRAAAGDEQRNTPRRWSWLPWRRPAK